jgi:predicted porin
LTGNWLTKFGLSLILFLAFSKAYSEDNRCTETWLGATTSIGIIDDFSLEAGFDLRNRAGDQKLKNVIFDLGVKYDVNDHLGFTSTYRNRVVYGKAQSEIMLDLGLAEKVKNMKLGYRLRYHARYRPSKDDMRHIRNKFELKYTIQSLDLSPSLHLEYYYLVFDPNQNIMDKYRIHAAIDYRINSEFNLSVQYIYEEFVHFEKDGINDIVRVIFSYKP